MIRETPFPMMVDAECGMPLDLLTYPGIWTGHGREGESSWMFTGFLVEDECV
jgi:hypothetical protein